MSDPTVPSPCINICAIDDITGYCKGCYRSVPEVAAWPTLSDDQKRAVLARLPARRPKN